MEENIEPIVENVPEDSTSAPKSRIRKAAIRVKADIKKAYLEGLRIKEIEERFGIKPRAIYYHLQPLTLEDKLQHLRARHGDQT